ncbi:hypothetical protein TNIN_360531 [Trichonephila inaurata madagascariensis]|uniref:Uncharacterized protein n=1 Tax=Trichonephila inaurata madagascariensis TaxID=2747483 RepID=A0A8X6XQC2_9ARAC|nr:hypothetical protein TNIN_360531 [Trichonephila inaurata madagascariensis]
MRHFQAGTGGNINVRDLFLSAWGDKIVFKILGHVSSTISRLEGALGYLGVVSLFFWRAELASSAKPRSRSHDRVNPRSIAFPQKLVQHQRHPMDAISDIKLIRTDTTL